MLLLECFMSKIIVQQNTFDSSSQLFKLQVLQSLHTAFFLSWYLTQLCTLRCLLKFLSTDNLLVHHIENITDYAVVGIPSCYPHFDYLTICFYYHKRRLITALEESPQFINIYKQVYIEQSLKTTSKWTCRHLQCRTHLSRQHQRKISQNSMGNNP